MHNTLLQILTVLHYFGELIAIGMRQAMVGETVDLILVKEGGVEIAFLFHSICILSQCYFYQNIMILYTLKIYGFLFVLRFHEKIWLRPKNALNPCILLPSFWQYTYILGDVIDIKSNDSGIHSQKEPIKHFVSKTLFWGNKNS